MSPVAHYVAFLDANFLPSVTHSFALPPNLIANGAAVLTYRVRKSASDNDQTYSISINGWGEISHTVDDGTYTMRSISEVFPASRLRTGSNDIRFQLEGGVTGANDPVVTFSDVVIWCRVDALNTPSVQITSAGNIFAGGDGNNDGDLLLRSSGGSDRIRLDAGQANVFIGGNNTDGDLMLFRPDVGNDNWANATIHLNGGGGDGRFGGNLANGKVRVYPNHVVAGGFTDAAASILLDGYGARVVIGGGGAGEIAASRDGELVVLGTSAQSTRVRLDGASGDISAAGSVRAAAFVASGTTLNVPDHVFGDSYALMPLPELRAFVARERHLPRVPAAAEVERDGVDLASFQMRLLEKVEELTCYLFAQHEALEAQRARIAQLEAAR